MTTVYVQFTDSTETAVRAIFANPQDPVAYPNQAAVPDTDARYLAFVDPGATPAGQLASRVLSAFAAGLTITSTGTPELNGTYAVDDSAQARIARVETFLQKNGVFPGATGSQLAWQDLVGGWHVFPSVALFAEFASAVGNFVTELDLYAAGAAGSSMPAGAVTIA